MKHVAVAVKMLFLFLICDLALFILLNTVGLKLMQKNLVESKEEKLYDLAEVLVSDHLSEYYKNNVDIKELRERLKVVARSTETRIWLTGSSGNVVVDAPNGKMVGQSISNLDENFFDETFVVGRSFKGYADEESLFVNLPFYQDYVRRGYLTISVPMSKIYDEGVYYSDFVNICLLLFMPVLLVIFVVIYITTVVPVNKLGEAAQRFSKGDFKEPLNVDYPLEYLGLGSAIKFMGDKLSNFESVQRKFLSDVSHDFRSPLTSIKGYIEAIKDGTIPVESQDKYLDIVVFETERLQKLTSNILDLNSFDSNGMILNRTEFDINAMTKQIAESFEGTVKKKRIVFNLVFSEKEQLVNADQDKIQQVLYNLIDNAIKFSNPDSQIRIKTEEKSRKVVVAVKDYGIGIPKDSINKVFDRFYKTDNSRGKDKKGTGLGLSIVKEIIRAHGENISVVSTEGAGSEFTFRLPVAE